MTITGNFRKWNVIFKRRATLLNAIADLKLTEIQKIQKQTDNNRLSKKLSFHQSIASELLDGQHKLLTDFKTRINHLLDWKSFLMTHDLWHRGDMVPKTFKSKASSIFDVLNEVNFVSDYVELILKWFFIKAICNFYHLNLNILIGRNIWSYNLQVLLNVSSHIRVSLVFQLSCCLPSSQGQTVSRVATTRY